MFKIYDRALPNNGYCRYTLLYPKFVWGYSDGLHGKVHTKEISINNKISLTGHERYVNFIIVILGFGIQIEIKE